MYKVSVEKQLFIWSSGAMNEQACNLKNFYTFNRKMQLKISSAGVVCLHFFALLTD